MEGTAVQRRLTWQVATVKAETRETLDGNAIAGLLHEIFGEEMTAVRVTCESCGFTAPVATTVVYPRLPGAVVRCRNCSALLMVITRARGVNCVDLSGIAAMKSPADT